MTTFSEARETVQKIIGARWKRNSRPGVFYVKPDGFEDDTHYLLIFGAEEWLVDEDPSYMLLDDGMVLVDKNTGKLVNITYLDDPDRIDNMSSVGVE